MPTQGLRWVPAGSGGPADDGTATLVPASGNATHPSCPPERLAALKAQVKRTVVQMVRRRGNDLGRRSSPAADLSRPALPRPQQTTSFICGAAWNTKLQELKSFKAANGHCNVPQKYCKNRALGAWVSRQRAFLREWEKKGNPNANDPRVIERRNLLIEIGLAPSIGKGQAAKVNGHFHTDNHVKEWEAKFAKLLAFREANGHCDVLQSKENRSLGRWVSRQREKYAAFAGDEKTGSLALEGRFERLRQIGFRFAP